MTRKRARGSRLSAVGVPLLVLALALDLVARMGEARMGSKLFSESPPEPDSKFSNKYVNEVSFSLNTEKDNPSLWIETLSWKPRAFVIHNMLTDEECDHMIRQGEVTIDRSTVVPHSDNRSSATSESRTSYGSFVNRYATETLGRIEEATAILTGIHMANGESLQILRYENGQQYKRHNDYFPEDYLREEDGMQRIATILFYLSDVEEGGETNFPEGTVLREYSERNLGTSDMVNDKCGGRLRAAVKPKKGDALLFFDMDPPLTSEDPYSTNEGCPVISGVKWSATIWMHQGHFRDYDYVASPTKCVDTNKECPNWAKNGECEKNPKYMNVGCRLSCGICRACEEGDVLCERKNMFG